jgi:hypothetical protein
MIIFSLYLSRFQHHHPNLPELCQKSCPKDLQRGTPYPSRICIYRNNGRPCREGPNITDVHCNRYLERISMPVKQRRRHCRILGISSAVMALALTNHDPSEPSALSHQRMCGEFAHRKNVLAPIPSQFRNSP